MTEPEPIAAPSPAASPYAADPATVAAEPAAPASPYLEPAAPISRQPYFVANVVVLGLSVLLFIGFWAKDFVFQNLLDWGLVVTVGALVLALGLFVTSLVLRSKTKRAGGKQGIAVAAIVLSSVNLLLVVATIAVVVFIFGMLFWFFGGGF